MSKSNPRLAVLIDAENVSYRLVEDIFEELARFGTPTVRRAYGDWTRSVLRGWSDHLLSNAIVPVQQFANTVGKNSSDFALVIDAMDLLYAGHVDGFAIVSSDGDFTRLVTRLRESAFTVIGMGERKTPDALVNACDQFIYLDLLEGAAAHRVVNGETTDAAEAPAPREVKPVTGELQSVLTRAMRETERDDGWSSLAQVGQYLTRSKPSFDTRDYGFAKLSSMARGLPYVEVRQAEDAPGSGQLWLRPKRAGRGATEDR